MKRHHIFISIILLFNIHSISIAQLKNNTPTQSYAKGTITGKIHDQLTDQPVEFATISIMEISDSSLVSGTVTDKNGHFQINNIPLGNYYLRISYIGYEDLLSKTFELTKNEPVKDFEKIGLKPKAENLEAVEITGEKQLYQNTIDKKVVNVDQNLVTQGGSATDVLRTLPSVEVDMDGNISLRGSQNVTILIDGRPSGMSGSDLAMVLEQIPASSIEKIEIITNPSAKYDPEGMSGILNIVLKKEQRGGTNGGVSVSIGTQDRYNASANVNHRSKNFNIYLNYSFRQFAGERTGKSFWQGLSSDSSLTIDQESEGSGKHQSHMVKTGIDYFLNEKNTIYFSTTFNSRDWNGNENTDYYNYNNVNTLLSMNNRFVEEGYDGYGLSYDLGYEKKFKDPNKIFNLDANYNINQYDRNGFYTQTNYDASMNLLGNPSLQNDYTNMDNQSIYIKANYEHPFSETAKMEIGYNGDFRFIDNDFYSENFVDSLQEYISNEMLNNRFLFDENIHAAYGTYSKTIGKFGVQGGVRLEQALTTSELADENKTFDNDYFSVFPTIHTSYKFSKMTEIQLSYTRRINRPSIWSLNPFTDYSDPVNLRRGNPYLKPEYINSIELGFSKYGKILTIMPSIYYRNVTDVIERIKTLDTSGISIVTYENLSEGTYYGLEFITVANLGRSWRLNLSANIYENRLNAENIQSNLSNRGINWFAKMVSDHKLPKDFSVQIMGFYRSPFTLTQGTMDEMYSIDAGAKKTFFNKKASVGIRISDLFDTRKFSVEIEDPSFYQTFERKWSSRTFFLTFSYNFGKMDPKQKRRRSNNNGDEMDGFNSMDF